MKITVFGATGGTGQHLVTDALAAGHAVTAVTRSRVAPGTEETGRPRDTQSARDAQGAEGAEVVQADVMDPGAIEAAVTGRDVVISTLGIRPGAKEPVCAPGTASIIKAMRATGVRRLVVVTAAGHVTDPHDGFLTAKLVKPILGVFLRRSFADFIATDQLVRESGLDWTIMRPSRLTNGGHKPYRTAMDQAVPGGMTISRADLAAATLAAATDPTTSGHAVTVGY